MNTTNLLSLTLWRIKDLLENTVGAGDLSRGLCAHNTCTKVTDHVRQPLKGRPGTLVLKVMMVTQKYLRKKGKESWREGCVLIGLPVLCNGIDFQQMPSEFNVMSQISALNCGNFKHCGEEDGLGQGVPLTPFKSHLEAPLNSSVTGGEFYVEIFTSKAFIIPKAPFSG